MATWSSSFLARSLWFCGLALCVLGGMASGLSAEDWMFRRSYFSHAVPEGAPPPNYPLPESRSAYRIAYYPHGFGVSTAYRWNNYVIQSGNRVDRTLYQEGWVQFVPVGE